MPADAGMAATEPGTPQPPSARRCIADQASSLRIVVEVRAMTAEDWPAVQAIYAEGIATGHATFEAAPPSWAEFDGGRHREHRFVAVDDGRIVGWAALSPTSTRACYRGVAEHSVYVTESARGRGVGRALMEALVTSTDAGGIWTIQTSVFPENEASVALHERVGFRIVGRRERIAELNGVWRDTLLLERRRRA
jgi:L-amino acid N-acyltransferase YncA